jgi:hypothetical protein
VERSLTKQGFAADLFTTLHCPTALVVKTTDQPLAAQQMTLLEEGASVIEWIAIVRPSSKNRALAAGTRRLVATARTRYLGFGTVKTEPIQVVHPNQQRQPSLNSLAPSQSKSQSRPNGSWGNDFAQSPYYQQQQQQQYQSHGQSAQVHQRPDISPTNSSVNNGFDWSSFPTFITPHQNQNTNTTMSQPQVPMQMLPVGQVSPMDLALPLSSPVQAMSTSSQIPTFGHLPMMPNQMDNWPLSMQNLGQLGMTPAPDPYAPSSEGFDMWLASILADGNGNGNGAGEGTGQDLNSGRSGY